MHQRADEIDAWVDADLIQILPTVLYGTWKESVHAARLTAKTSEERERGSGANMLTSRRTLDAVSPESVQHDVDFGAEDFVLIQLAAVAARDG